MATLAKKKKPEKKLNAKAKIAKKVVKPKIINKPVKKTAKVKTKTVKKSKQPAWEVVLNVMSPTIKRPRRTSLHTLATVIGAKDPLELAEAMKKSGKVFGYVCPDVQTPIFYLKSLANHPGMIDDHDHRVWGKWLYEDAGATSLPDFVKKNPYPKVKGFKRFAGYGHWTGGMYGKGKYIAASSAMNVPYEKEDYAYARAVIKALKDAGYKPGISEKDLKAPTA